MEVARKVYASHVAGPDPDYWRVWIGDCYAIADGVGRRRARLLVAIVRVAFWIGRLRLPRRIR